MKKLKLITTISCIAFSFSLLIFLFCFFYQVNSEKDYGITTKDINYSIAINNSVSELEIKETSYGTTMREFEEGQNIAVYETQGIPLALAHERYAFEPHLTQTIVIAVDRSQCNEVITSFKDLLTTDVAISFGFGSSIATNMWEYDDTHQIVLAMSKAIYGEYDVDAIAQDFAVIEDEDRFFVNDTSQAILVTTDSNAVALNKAGRNLEIVIPEDGTLSFDYGALIYNNKINFNEQLQTELINIGYRLPDGRCDADYYPDSADYTRASYIENYGEYNVACSLVSKTLRRDSFHTRLFGFTNSIETTTFFLGLVFVIIYYFVSIKRRISDRKINKATTIVLILLASLITMGLLKSVNSNNPFLETVLWYSYYIPILFVPAIFVYIALHAGNQNVKPNVIKAYFIYFLLTFIPLILIMTNNSHNWVFIVENYWTTTFKHNVGYYFVMLWVAASVAFAYGLLVYKCIKNPKKWALAYPGILSIVLVMYTIALAVRFTPVREFDVSFAITILVLLYIESLIQSRLLPTNKGYDRFFKHSNLAMKIEDNQGRQRYTSYITKDINENFVQRSTTIVGGKFYYFEDYTALRSAERKLEKINEKIKKNNKILLQKSETKEKLVALSAEKAAYDSIDNILLVGTSKIAKYIDKIKTSDEIKRIMNIISIHAMVMKRACMYRINALYQDNQPISILANSFIELKELSNSVGLSITVHLDIATTLPIQYMSDMYGFFVVAFEQAFNLSCEKILLQLYKEEDKIIFSILSEKALFDKEHFTKLKKNGANYSLTAKVWEDTLMYLLTFKIK